MRAKNQIRIIGGIHRGRRLPVADLPGLRPTGDRIRETLFNWLQPLLPGARCLDLFAGSGALGIEAASRGAGTVVMLERAGTVVLQLRENISRLRLKGMEIIQADALQWLDRPGKPFDIIFLDPPFGDDLLQPCCQLLDANRWLRSDARIYIETDAEKPLAPLPVNWISLKAKRAGQVCFYLYNS